ncbi:MAG: hypothetical protein H0X37_13115 [Herpetosiphonaceae bacterium]|nr:hypothetical protein [Herpetosiphonaceae bacterium]
MIRIEKPRLGVPVTLIVDDPTPCINPLYYYRLQVDGKNYEQHVQSIPFDFMHHFVAVCKLRGIRGKFSILPYPAGLGSILHGWEGCDMGEITRWLDMVRADVVPNFDITPEILTHTRALDLSSGTMLEQSEQAWMADQSQATLAAYMSAAMRILQKAGFVAAGITQPVSFSGSRSDYAQATLEAVRSVGGPAVTFHFIDEHIEGPPFWDPKVVLLDRERGEAVVNIANTCRDYCWNTQQPLAWSAAEVVDRFITADGRAGRLVELIAGDGWLITVCHWQSIFSDGSRAGLMALDVAFARLAQHVGPRLLWMKNSEIAQYQAATAACAVTIRPLDGGIEVEFDAAIPCPDFTFSLLHTADARREAAVVRQVEGGAAETLVPMRDEGVLLPPGHWHQTGEGVGVCMPLQRGRQWLRLTFGSR